MPGLPAELDEIVMRCLAKLPEQRHADAQTLARELAWSAAAIGGKNPRTSRYRSRGRRRQEPPRSSMHVETRLGIGTEPIEPAKHTPVSFSPSTRTRLPTKLEVHPLAIALMCLTASVALANAAYKWFVKQQHSSALPAINADSATRREP